MGNQSIRRLRREREKSKITGFRRLQRSLGVGFIILTVFFQLFLSNSLSAEGEEIRKIEREKMDLISQNLILREKSASLGSLSRIKSEAEQSLGMMSGQGQIDFVIPPGLASR